MKPVHTTLLASAFFAVTYIVAPGNVNAGGRECLTQTISKSTAAQQVDYDLEVALKVARSGKSVRAEVDKIEGSVTNLQNMVIQSLALTNVREAYGLDLEYLKDSDGDGFPDAIDPEPLKPGYRDGVR